MNREKQWGTAWSTCTEHEGGSISPDKPPCMVSQGFSFETQLKTLTSATILVVHGKDSSFTTGEYKGFPHPRQ